MSVVDQLRAAGVCESRALDLARVFRSRGEGTRFFVPGRIELVGKHTDYAGGSSLTIATSRGLAVTAAPLDGDVLRVEVLDRGLQCEMPLSADASGEGWMHYPATLVRRVMRNVPGAGRGAVVQLCSDLPEASGLSSSSAFLTALFLGWSHAAGWIKYPLLQDALRSDQDLADYVACIENGRSFRSFPGDRGVGTAGGSQDHTAIVQSRPGMVQRFRYIDYRREGAWNWPAGYRPVVISSGVRAEKTGDAMGAYNALSAATGGGYAGLGASALLEMEGELRGDALRRLEAYRWEMECVEAASLALAAGEVGALAAAVNRSQEGAEELLRNQVPETVFLCGEARRCGALAATAFGAGFGGAVWALVPAGGVPGFGDAVLPAYHDRFGARGEAFAEAAGPGAFFLDGRGLLG